MAKRNLFIPISIKLITIISAIILISLVVTTLLITGVIHSDVRVTAENNNFSLNQHSASEAEIFFNSVIANTNFILKSYTDSSFQSILDNDGTITAIIIPDKLILFNNNYFYSKGIDTINVSNFIDDSKDFFERAKAGETILLNVSPFFNNQMLALIMPLDYNGTTSAAASLFSPDSLIDTFGSCTNKAILINNMGDVLVSSDIDSLLKGTSIADSNLFSIIKEESGRQKQFVLKEDKTEHFTSFCKLLSGNAIVITQIQSDIVFEALQIATRRNIYLSITVLFTAILFVWFFSKTITTPVQNLGDAVKKIELGEYDIHINIKSHDELSILSKSITSMSHGLAEKERLKETFGKFINSEIAERAARGDLKLGGENKNVTVFFTDIRSFTAISEKLTPETVVAFLNEYMEIMVECISKTNGNVDKFIGDAIMAVWGAPLAGKSEKDDALSAVISALLMRYSLIRYNQNRQQNGRAAVHMGCGINSGPVTAGQIGSHKRMEYTVIGDTVNLASRIESINKTLSTDILISENTYNLVKDEIITQEMPSFFVKGKDKPVRLFAVIALKNTSNTPLEFFTQPKDINELWSLLGNAPIDITCVDINEEEKKYKIQN